MKHGDTIQQEQRQEKTPQTIMFRDGRVSPIHCINILELFFFLILLYIYSRSKPEANY